MLSIQPMEATTETSGDCADAGSAQSEQRISKLIGSLNYSCGVAKANRINVLKLLYREMRIAA